MKGNKGVIYTVIVVLAAVFVWNLTKIDLSKIDMSNQQENKEQQEENEIRLERNIKIPKGETRKFIFPKALQDISKSSSETTEEAMRDLTESNDEERVYEEIELNKDDTISLWVTAEQLEWWLVSIEESLNKNIKGAEERGVKVEISPEWTDITYRVTKENTMTLQQWGFGGQVFMGTLFEAQVFTGVPQEDIYVHELVIQEVTGEVLVDATSPGSNYKITESQWQGKEEDSEGNKEE